MLLFVGLGNPGARYAGNRHNIGFMALDSIANRHRASPWRTRFKGEACDVTLETGRALMLKPLTFMNESGRAVREAMDFYKIDLKAIYVFHDELDLPPGKLRLKTGGGTAGHNGLRSISQHCGNDYPRVRLGIGHPGDKALVHGYVLSDFAKAEQDWVNDLCASIADHAALLGSQDALFANRIHLGMETRGHGSTKTVMEAGRALANAKKAGQGEEPR
ncbi:Pth Peptidyl-tRNA hydrolase [Rhabdaerophilaceae bacterium]